MAVHRLSQDCEIFLDTGVEWGVNIVSSSTQARTPMESNMKKFITKTMLALGVAATVLAGAMNPAMAAPLATNNAAVKEAASSDLIEVRHWRGRHFAGALIGLGALALIYEGSRRHHRYHRHYYYDPYYAYGYGPACIRRHGQLYCR